MVHGYFGSRLLGSRPPIVLFYCIGSGGRSEMSGVVDGSSMDFRSGLLGRAPELLCFLSWVRTLRTMYL